MWKRTPCPRKGLINLDEVTSKNDLYDHPRREIRRRTCITHCPYSHLRVPSISAVPPPLHLPRSWMCRRLFRHSRLLVLIQPSELNSPLPPSLVIPSPRVSSVATAAYKLLGLDNARVLVEGPSGAGKTTLLSHLLRVSRRLCDRMLWFIYTTCIG